MTDEAKQQAGGGVGRERRSPLRDDGDDDCASGRDGSRNDATSSSSSSSSPLEAFLKAMKGSARAGGAPTAPRACGNERRTRAQTLREGEADV